MQDKPDRTAKTYRLTAKTLQQIGEICEAENVSATKAVEKAIDAYFSSDCTTQSNSNSNADESSTDATLVSILREQLAVKDGQIARLTDELAASLNRSQTLQGLAVRKQSLPQRVRAWFLGDSHE